MEIDNVCIVSRDKGKEPKKGPRFVRQQKTEQLYNLDGNKKKKIIRRKQK